MVTQRHYAIEAHPVAATVYLIGAVSVAGLLEAMRRCEALPQSVWILRVDISATEPLDQGTHTVLTHALRRWRDERSGITELIRIPRQDPASPTTTRHAWRPPRSAALAVLRRVCHTPHP